MKLSDPYVNNGQQVPIAVNFADPVEEATLHMVNTDPARTPSFTMFGNDDFFFTAAASGPSCGSNPCVSPTFAWNHGDVQQEIGNTWVGMVGPGVAANGVDPTTWTDHTNLRPTIMALTGLKDDYTEDGVVLSQGLTSSGTPPTLDAQRTLAQKLGQLYEQLNAPFGQFGNDTLKASTNGIESNVRFDSAYHNIEEHHSAPDRAAKRAGRQDPRRPAGGGVRRTADQPRSSDRLAAAGRDPALARTPARDHERDLAISDGVKRRAAQVRPSAAPRPRRS